MTSILQEATFLTQKVLAKRSGPRSSLCGGEGLQSSICQLTRKKQHFYNFSDCGNSCEGETPPPSVRLCLLIFLSSLCLQLINLNTLPNHPFIRSTFYSTYFIYEFMTQLLLDAKKPQMPFTQYPNISQSLIRLSTIYPILVNWHFFIFHIAEYFPFLEDV